MTHGSEHEELRAAFGEQVAGLPIGTSPIDAVLRDGGALRSRRRIAMTSGVAALAVLPVAAVAVFAGGTGSGSSAEGRIRAGGTATTVRTAATTAAATEAKASPTSPRTGPTTAKAYKTIPPATGTHVNQPDTPAAPNPHDQYAVLAHGTLGKQHWRLVRDRFAVKSGQYPSEPGQPNNHLPSSQQGHAGTDSCEGLGLQWGDGPVGAYPDYEGATTCATYEEVVGSSGTFLNPAVYKGPTLVEVTGRVEFPKVASVTLTVGDWSTVTTPIIPSAGDSHAYYVILLDRSVMDSAGGSYSLTLRDGEGNVVDSPPVG